MFRCFYYILLDLSWKTDSDTYYSFHEIICFGGTKTFITVSMGAVGSDLLIAECISLSDPLFLSKKHYIYRAFHNVLRDYRHL